MRVELTLEIFTDPEAEAYDAADLYRLLESFGKRLHDWVTDPAIVDAVAGFLPKHLPMMADTYIELARDAFVAGAWTGTTQVGEVVRVTAADLADHAADLCQPAVLVVEDQDSDSCFLRAVAHALSDHRVRAALGDHRRLVIENGGGSSLVKVAENAASRYRRVIRVVALLDSDRLIPRQRTGSHDKADRLAKLNVAVHVLARREAENYVPYRVLAGIGRRSSASRRLDLLKRLTAEQRGYLDMKHGFGKAGPPPAVLPDQRDLFDPLDRDVRLGLHDGFGKDLLKRMDAAKETLTERDFAQLGDDVVAELKALLATIASKI